MKRLIILLSILLIAGSVSALDIYTWDTNLESAQAVADVEGKHLFVYFAGSDWCGWCDRFHKEILTTSRFESYLDESFVPVLIDFPRGIEQTEQLKADNQALAQRMGIEGFPTVVFLDAQGTEIGRLGYLPGGPNNYISEVRSIIKADS
ncbi:MAG: thioredoxin family protein [Spirochaetaceae bacterium]